MTEYTDKQKDIFKDIANFIVNIPKTYAESLERLEAGQITEWVLKLREQKITKKEIYLTLDEKLKEVK